MFGTNLFLALSMYIVLPIVYFTMRNNTVCKNGLILSVTIPPEHQGDKAVMELCDGFRRAFMRTFLWLTLALVPCLFLPWVSVSATWSMVWLLVAIGVPMWVYGRWSGKLKRLKKERGWASPTAGQTVVDLKAAPLPKPLSAGWFLPPVILSVLPVVSAFGDAWEPGWRLTLGILSVSNLIIAVLSLFFYRYVFRTRGELVSGDREKNAALTRIRRSNWAKFWLASVWLTAGYSLAAWLCQGDTDGFLVWTLVYCCLLLAVSLWTEIAVRRAQRRLTREDTGPIPVDEDDLWVWGQFYWNPNSRKAMVNERVGMGMSMNFAHPAGKAMAVFTALVLAAMPLLGVWLMVEEFSPLKAETDGEVLTVSQAWTKYEIPLDEITGTEVLDSLPRATRTWGTGMTTLLKGSFSVEGYGNCTLCLDPTDPPFLVIEAGRTYILGGEAAEAVRP